MDAVCFLAAAAPSRTTWRPRIKLPTAASRRRRRPISRQLSIVASSQFNVAKVIATAWRISKDGVEAGAKLIPDSVPRPVARISVAAAAVAVALFLLKSLISTVLFVAAMMGLIYFAYMALNAGEEKSGDDVASAGDDETLEEARRIMEKYK